MKKCLCLVLAAWLLALTGCGNAIDNSGYVPTGNAILMEGQNPEDILPEEEITQELVLAYYPDRSLNPVFGSDYTNRVLMSLMYQPLFAVNNQKVPTPILCQQYRSGDSNRSWFVYIDPNATFSDGAPVTIQDVLATYQKAMENDYYVNRFRHVLKVGLTEDGTGILFQLDTGIADFPLLLDVPIVKASEVEAALPLGSGPYVFVETAGGARLQRDPSWWCGSAVIPAKDPTISLVEVSSPAQIRDEFQFGNVNVACTNPMSDSFAEYRCDYELWEMESGYMMYIGCNIQWSDFFEDGTLRTALTYAIDRATLAQDAYKGMVYPVTLPCSPTESYYSQNLASRYQYDSMRFIEFLGGYTIPRDEDHQPKTLSLLVNAEDSARVRVARAIAENLTNLGLPCKTDECSAATFQAKIQNANYDIYLGMTRLSATNDLAEFFRPWGEMSWGGLSNENLVSLNQFALADRGNFLNLYSVLADDGRIIPVMFGYYVVYVERGLLPDLSPGRDNLFYYSLGKTMESALIQPNAQANAQAETTPAATE